MSSLLKAYLMGSNDPIILAKAYYDDLILKDVQSVEMQIEETLGFNIDEEVEFWIEEYEDLKAEHVFWHRTLENFNNVDIFGFRTEEGHYPFASEGEAVRVTPQHYDEKYIWGGLLETIPYKEIPDLLDELQASIRYARLAIKAAEEQYSELVEELTGLDFGTFEQRGTWDDDNFIPWDDETYIKVHRVGLSYCEDKVEYYTNRFQTLKDNKELPSIRPEILDLFDSKMKELNDTWDAIEQDAKKPTAAQKRQKVAQLEQQYKSILQDTTNEGQWKWYEDKIKSWTSRKNKSEKQLKEYLEGKETQLGIEELRALGRKKGFRYDQIKELWWKPKTSVQHKTKKNPKGELPEGKNWYTYNYDTKTFEKVKEKPKSKVKSSSGNLTYSSSAWWETLAETSTPEITIEGKIYRKKGFLNALKQFFKRPKSSFNKKPIEGKTATGIGRVEFENNRKKIIRERPNIRLSNLQELNNIFEALPSSEKTKMNVRIIMGALADEIGYQRDELDRKAQGKLSNTQKGKEVMERLVKSLESAYNKSKYYTSDREFSSKFLNDISEIKKTGMSLDELKNFAENRVVSEKEPKLLDNLPDTQKEEQQRKIKRREHLRNTFDRRIPLFKKMVKLLNKSMKENKKLIDLIEEAWDDKNVFKPSTGKSSEEEIALRKLMDIYAGKLSEILDEKENVIVYPDGYTEEEIEGVVESLKSTLERIDEAAEHERTDELFDWFVDLVENFQETTTHVLQRLSPNSNSYKQINELKQAVLNELEEIPELEGLITLEEAFDTTPHRIIESRISRANQVINTIALRNANIKDENGNDPYVWLNQYMTNPIKSNLEKPNMSDNKKALLAYVDSRLPIAQSARGKKMRENLIHKIIDIGLDNTKDWSDEDKEIKRKDVSWDISDTKKRRIWGRGYAKKKKYTKDISDLGPTTEHEEYDETDEGERHTTEMVEGADEHEGEELDIGELAGHSTGADAFEQEFGEFDPRTEEEIEAEREAEREVEEEDDDPW